MCAPCERVRRGSEAATLAYHRPGQNRFSGASAQMRLRQRESVEPASSLV